MGAIFKLVIVSPEKILFQDEVSEVVLPSYDGEVGVLPGHSDFVGLLGTGSLRVVKEGIDHWFIISSGVYQVDSGMLIICAELAENGEGIDIQSATAIVEELERVFADRERFSAEDYPAQKMKYDLNRARLEVCQRMQSMH